MLTGGFQLLAEVSDDLLRRLAVNETQYRLLAQIGIRSLMVVPLVTRGQIAGIITFAYTRRSRAAATAATIRRWPRSWRCTPPTRSRTPA